MLLAAVPAALGLAVLAAIARRRALGLPPGVGFPHDPVVADPAAHLAGGAQL
jgi:hypothetical protein